MKHVYIVRHGQSEMNVAGQFAGQVETPLTDEGRQQARKAGKQAQEFGIDLIITSSLSRAHETARIIAHEIGYPEDKIAVDDLLIERDFGSAEGTPYSPDFDFETVPDVEPLNVLHDRLAVFYTKLQNLPAENILVVTHGSSGRMLRTVVKPEIPFNSTGSPLKEHHLPNAKIVQLI